MALSVDAVELPSGVRLSYAAQGDPSGTPLVLLHGFGDSWRAYERVLPHLPERIRTLALTLFGSLLQEDLSSELHRIQAPTLLVSGDQDAVLSSGDAEAIAAAIPRSELRVYPGAGHSVHWEEPERLAADLVAFVEGGLG